MDIGLMRDTESMQETGLRRNEVRSRSSQGQRGGCAKAVSDERRTTGDDQS